MKLSAERQQCLQTPSLASWGKPTPLFIHLQLRAQSRKIPQKHDFHLSGSVKQDLKPEHNTDDTGQPKFD